MDQFVIVKVSDEDVDVSPGIHEHISAQELSFMHYSAMGEILKGNPSDLNKKLYRATKGFIDDHVDSLLESK